MNFQMSVEYILVDVGLVDEQGKKSIWGQEEIACLWKSFSLEGEQNWRYGELV